MASPYPAHWEADVVLRDGGTAHLRPIRPDDADRLRDFHAHLSPETIYFRFFAPYPTLTDRDVARFTQVDYVNRVAIVAMVGDDFIGVVRYDKVAEDEAEVAFTVRDDHQARGLGSVLLEHLAAAARERDLHRFVAEVLPTNSRMITVFREAGYEPRTSMEEGYLLMEFAIDPTEHSRAVMESREHRAEARSIERLLSPRSVAVVGASARPESVGDQLLRDVVDSGFTGPVYAINPRAEGSLRGVPTYPDLASVPGDVDLALVAVPAAAVDDVVAAAAAKGVHGLVVVSSGFAEAGPEGRDRQLQLVAEARANGMRVLGPNCLGIINTDPSLSLNASLSPVMPGRGRIGFFSQSGALGVALLETVVRRGLGLSTFVSAGNRADVSGNDLMQYWEDDPATDVLLLYIESIGNPRKFSRIARRTSRSKPIVAVKTGRSSQGIPLGHTVRATRLPAVAIDEMFEQSGVIQVDGLGALFDVASLLTFQPLPQGRRVSVVGNSDALAVLAADACAAHDLQLVGEPHTFRPDARPEELGATLAGVVEDPAVDSVVVLFLPGLNATGEQIAREIAQVAGRATKPIVATVLAVEGAATLLRRMDPEGRPMVGSVPTYGSVEDAVKALAAVTRYAAWRRSPRGELPELDDVDTEAAQDLVDALLTDPSDGVDLEGPDLATLLACYGIELWPTVEVSSADQAVAAAEELGFPVVLKAVAPHLVHRTDLGGVRLDLGSEQSLRRAYDQIIRTLGAGVAERLVVQRMAQRGVACVIGSTEDALFGPVVSFGIGGVVSELVQDRGYRIPPLTDRDAAALVRSPLAAPLLFGYRGAELADVSALEQLLLRVSRLADDLPEMAELELNPVVAGPDGVAVLGARARLARPIARKDADVRRL